MYDIVGIPTLDLERDLEYDAFAHDFSFSSNRNI